VATLLIEPVEKLIEAFNRLPGIGPKTAQRLTFHILRAPDVEARTLAAALVAARDEVVFCERCFNISDAPLCPICRDPGRDQSRLCVVEEPLDVLALERTAEFRGVYHVLHGAISPIDGVGPDRLRIRELLARVDEAAETSPFVEVILATNPTLEGEATAMYLDERMAGKVGSVTRIARGIPVGGDLEYADEVTLIRALQGRRALGDRPAERGRGRRMQELVVEIGLRIAKVLIASLIGLVIYLVVTGPLGVPGSAQLALESWIAGALVFLILETGIF
jgi:recombination protein RecR